MRKRRIRILCADDSYTNLRLLEAFLTKRDFSVNCVEDGQQALHCLQENPDTFDLVITDYEMPRMNGLVLAKHVSAILGPQRVILLTACADYAELQGSEELFSCRLTKPFAPEKLLQAIAESVNGSLAISKK